MSRSTRRSRHRPAAASRPSVQRAIRRIAGRFVAWLEYRDGAAAADVVAAGQAVPVRCLTASRRRARPPRGAGDGAQAPSANAAESSRAAATGARRARASACVAARVRRPASVADPAAVPSRKDHPAKAVGRYRMRRLRRGHGPRMVRVGLSTAITVASFTVASPARAADLPSLTESTTIAASHAAYTDVVVPTDLAVREQPPSFALEGEGEVLGSALQGHSSGCRPTFEMLKLGRSNDGPRTYSTGCGGDGTLPAGRYRLYFLSEKPGRVTVRFPSLPAGATTVSPTEPAPFTFTRLPQLPWGTAGVETYGATETLEDDGLAFLRSGFAASTRHRSTERNRATRGCTPGRSGTGSQRRSYSSGSCSPSSGPGRTSAPSSSPAYLGLGYVPWVGAGRPRRRHPLRADRAVVARRARDPVVAEPGDSQRRDVPGWEPWH